MQFQPSSSTYMSSKNNQINIRELSGSSIFLIGELVSKVMNERICPNHLIFLIFIHTSHLLRTSESATDDRIQMFVVSDNRKSEYHT